MNKKTSLADIAKSLGVSKTLVSLVLNNKGDAHGISADTQQKVKAKIRELNYEPNAMARGFRTGKTNTIGLIVSDISNRFYASIARNIEDLAWSKGYTVIICSSDENVEKEKKQISMLLDKKIEGIIVSTSQETSGYFDQLNETGLPHVLIDRTFATMNSPHVSVDNYNGGRMAALHLLQQDIKSAAIIGISPDHISTINDRIKGFETAMAEVGISIPPEWQIRAPFAKMDEVIKDSLQKFLQQGNLPEAIFTLNNNLTSSCLQHLRNLSVKIPDQIALIGFDEVLYFGFTQPSVSAISQPIDLMSQKAFELLISQIEKIEIPAQERSVCLPVELIIRESSLKPLLK